MKLWKVVGEVTGQVYDVALNRRDARNRRQIQAREGFIPEHLLRIVTCSIRSRRPAAVHRADNMLEVVARATRGVTP